MRNKIRIDTMTDALDFVKIVSNCSGAVNLESPDGFRVNGKSILGVLAGTEFSGLWVVSDEDIYNKIERFIVVE